MLEIEFSSEINTSKLILFLSYVSKLNITDISV